MRKIILLLVLVSVLENAFADNSTKSGASQESTELKTTEGKPSFWCKSWKEHGAAWEFWPLYKMGKSSCEPNRKE